MANPGHPIFDSVLWFKAALLTQWIGCTDCYVDHGFERRQTTVEAEAQLGKRHISSLEENEDSGLSRVWRHRSGQTQLGDKVGSIYWWLRCQEWRLGSLRDIRPRLSTDVLGISARVSLLPFQTLLLRKPNKASSSPEAAQDHDYRVLRPGHQTCQEVISLLSFQESPKSCFALFIKPGVYSFGRIGLIASVQDTQ